MERITDARPKYPKQLRDLIFQNWKFLLPVLILIFALGSGSGFLFFKKHWQKAVQTVNLKNQEDPYAAFTAEVYDKIMANYWEEISDKDLSNFFRLGVGKLTNKTWALESEDKTGVENLIAEASKDFDEQKKKEFVLVLGDAVLSNLKPFGRSRLLGTKQQEELKNNVVNIDKTVDLYQTLGIEKDASPVQVKKTYEEKKKELTGDTSEKAIKELAQIERAYQALSNQEKKEVYDKYGVEPTVVHKSIGANIVYIQVKKISPNTFEEFKKSADEINGKAGKSENPDTLILDLRGNVGGAIDTLQYFLGPFIGENQYAYDFYHKNQYMPFKTKTGWLPSLTRYKKVVILADEKAQSSAEVMVAALKKYNVGIVVGTPTKGWGTVEGIFEMESQLDPNEKYSILMVHSLALRDDNQPIEGRGVDPTININDKNWDKELLKYFSYPELVRAVKETYGK